MLQALTSRPWSWLRHGVAVWLAAWWLAAGAAPRPELAEPRFESIGDAAAVSDGVVSTLAVDPRGFLWVGTAIGLVRFDGYEFLQLRLPSDSKRPNATSFVRTLLPARDGTLWVGTDSDGLGQLEPDRGEWRFFRPDAKNPEGFARGTVRALIEDPEGRIWAGTVGGGLQQVDPASGKVTHFGLAQGLPDDRVQSLALDNQGTLWVGTWNGLALRARGQARFERAALPLAGEDGALGGRIISVLRFDSAGVLWVGTQRGELLRVNLRSGTASWLDRGDSGGGAVQALVEMDRDELWVGRGNALEIRRRSDGQLLRQMRHRASRPWGPAGSDIRAMTRDASGVLWMGSYGGGLQRHAAETPALWIRRGELDEDSVLGVVDVRSLVELPNGEIWAGTNDRGVAVLDAELRLKASFRPGQHGYPSGRAGGIARSQDGHVWAGAGDKVSQIEPVARRLLGTHALGRGTVRVMLGPRDGSVLAGTSDGLFRKAPGTVRFERVGLVDGQALKGDINTLIEDGEGRVWVGGERGLFSLAPGAGVLEPAPLAAGESLGDDAVLGLLVDARQQLWLDSSAGLRRLVRSPQGLRIERVSERIGQGGKSFGANLLQDNRGRIWTHRGVFDPETGQFDELTSADGVDLGTAWFRSYTALRDGRMLFGGSRGLLVLDPHRFVPWRYQPPVVATELRINGQAEPLSRLQPQLRLMPGERNFNLEVAALDLSLPGRNRYRHRLEGFDADWIPSDAQERQLNYGGLAPGHYRLLVQGSNRNGHWSPKLLELEIEVVPAWWQTWWARALGVLGVLTVLYAAVQLRTRLLRRRQRELEARVAERTLALETLSEALKEKTEALEQSALTDPLTGLRNRRFVTERLDDDLHLVLRQHEEALRHGQPPPMDSDLCFFLLDLDHFKQVNDQHGHAAGDALLTQMRERLQEVFRESDYLVRWGGEEFLVVARGSSRASAPDLAERARRAVVERPFMLPQGRTLVRSCSIGFACFPLLPAEPRATGWALVVDLADAALYCAKREGRNRWVGVLDADPATVMRLQAGLPERGRLPEGLRVLRGPAGAAGPAPGAPPG